MDRRLVLLTIATLICGNYMNEANRTRPEPFQGRFAQAIINPRYPKTIPKPDYLKHYGSINVPAGNIYINIL